MTYRQLAKTLALIAFVPVALMLFFYSTGAGVAAYTAAITAVSMTTAALIIAVKGRKVAKQNGPGD